MVGVEVLTMPVAQIFSLPALDGTDGSGPRPPFSAALIPWIALTVALTAIACVWLGRASVPFMLALAAWAGIALARQRPGAAPAAIATATPTGPHVRLVPGLPAGERTEGPRAAERRTPVLRLVTRQ